MSLTAASTNSIYAVRIKFLDSELSQLKNQLLEKEEQIIRLENQVDSLNEDPAIIRREVEVKLQEVLDAIGRLPHGEVPQARRRGKSPRASPLKRPERPPPVDDEYETRLPSISEEKRWPRLSVP